MSTREELEAKAIEDYRKVLGTIITVHILSGYQDDDCHDFDGWDYQVRVIETPEDDLCHWVDQYLDPYWNVEPVAPVDGRLDGHRNFWTFGPGYKL